MKVLMLGWELPPHNSGGLGVACHGMCKALSAKGVDIEFILPYSANHNVNFMKITPAINLGVANVQKNGTAYDSARYIFTDGTDQYLDIFDQQTTYEHAVAAHVKGQYYDIIHAHDWLTFRAGLRAKQILGAPLILHVHSIESDRAAGGHGNPIVREIEEISMLMADKVISVSQHTKNRIIEDYSIPEDKIEVVHNSIDAGDLEKLNDENIYRYLTLLKSKDYKIVTNIGRQTIQKGLTNLLRAAQIVIAREPKTIFLMVGAGEQYNELLELAAELGISRNVIFTGFQRGAKWRDAFAISDLFVMPSVSEPFGLTPLEAIAYGVPSLISKQSGISEILQNSLKTDYWDVNEMANLITAAVQNSPLRQELVTNSYKEFERLSWHNSAAKLIDIYDQHTREVVMT